MNVQSREAYGMSKATKKSILFALGVLVLIAFAMWLRYASRHIFHSPVVSHLRSGIYVFLFSVWCYSLWIRIVQTQVRRYLLAISVLMVLWILLRSIKFSIENTDVERWLWYFYYFPMLFIPMLSVFVSRSLGKGEDFRLPRWTKILYVPTLLLLLLVLTNDLHQQVFSFPSGVLSDREYRYEGGYFFVMGWEALCAGFAFLSMAKNCRIPRSRRIRWLPLLAVAQQKNLCLRFFAARKRFPFRTFRLTNIFHEIYLRAPRADSYRNKQDSHNVHSIILKLKPKIQNGTQKKCNQ